MDNLIHTASTFLLLIVHHRRHRYQEPLRRTAERFSSRNPLSPTWRFPNGFPLFDLHRVFPPPESPTWHSSMAIRLSCIDAVPSSSDAILTQLPITIGRGDEADICIRDTWASRVHCRLSLREGRLHLEDLRSSNGTMVNGVQVQASFIERGDQITVGITTFRVAYSRLPESQQATPSESQTESTSSPMLAGS